LDVARWQQQTGQQTKRVDASSAITVEELEAVAKHQGTTLKPGDILIVRMGFTDWYEGCPSSERDKAMDNGAFIGLEASMKMVKWLWNHHFAAVACDSLGLEVCPAPFGQENKICLHEWMLAHWGCPIGELWNLEDLSRLCSESQRWSFFLTSAPLHVFGGVGSPPNAIAIL
jgi:kynurenine formamidase